MAGMSFPWRAVAPTTSATTTFWSPELLDTLDRYLAAARDYLAAGRVERAVAVLEAALADVPGIPAPRRQTIRRLIRETVCASARRALRGPVPDQKSAMQWLQRALRSAEGSDDDGHADVLQTYGLLLHLSADLRGAVQYYTAASEVGGPTASTDYGNALARLQTAWATPQTVGAAVDDGRPTTWSAEHIHPLHGMAWRRLRAMTAVYHGGVRRAVSVFPGPDTPKLPRAWALEGALLAAMSADWTTSLQFYRRALDSQGFSGIPSDGLHRLVFVAVAWECVKRAAMPNTNSPLQSSKGELPTNPASPNGQDASERTTLSDIEKLVMAERLPQRPPTGMSGISGTSGMSVSSSAYRAWVGEIRGWQQRLWIRHALQQLPDGNDEELRRSLRALMQLRPGGDLARWIGVWLACTAGLPGTSRLLHDSHAGPGNPRHVMQLSVLAAEKLGHQEHVIDRLNLLLRRYPDDRWGLSRWREWMMKLADEATAEGRYKQALFQYVSLTLYLPDDADGWNGCARVLELMGDDARAEDCRQEAKRVQRLSRKSRTRELSGAGDSQHRPELAILEALLADPDHDPAAGADFPFSNALLRQAVWESLQAPDVYLRALLARWAGGPTSFPNVG